MQNASSLWLVMWLAMDLDLNDFNSKFKPKLDGRSNG
jgi:hypothetical protein